MSDTHKRGVDFERCICPFCGTDARATVAAEWGVEPPAEPGRIGRAVHLRR